jgi:hypothetical protein
LEALKRWPAPQDSPAGPLARRVEATAALFARRRYAVPLEDFAGCLIGGAEDPGEVLGAIEASERLGLVDGFVVARAQDYDLEAWRERRAAHKEHRAKILEDAVAFGEDLVKTFPFIRAICLTGSLASGGYTPADDVDFNLFVDDRAKYSAYLTSILLSLKYSLKHRGKPELEEGRTPLLPKVICINVIFRERDCSPFLRRDRYLGFELLLQEPIYGVGYYREIVSKNRWLQELFPQLGQKLDGLGDRVRRPERAPLHALWHADPLRLSETASRLLTRAVFEAVQLSRRRNPKAQEHVARVRQFQYPYGVFQD